MCLNEFCKKVCGACGYGVAWGVIWLGVWAYLLDNQVGLAFERLDVVLDSAKHGPVFFLVERVELVAKMLVLTRYAKLTVMVELVRKSSSFFFFFLFFFFFRRVEGVAQTIHDRGRASL